MTRIQEEEDHCAPTWTKRTLMSGTISMTLEGVNPSLKISPVVYVSIIHLCLMSSSYFLVKPYRLSCQKITYLLLIIDL